MSTKIHCVSQCLLRSLCGKVMLEPLWSRSIAISQDAKSERGAASIACLMHVCMLTRLEVSRHTMAVLMNHCVTQPLVHLEWKSALAIFSRLDLHL